MPKTKLSDILKNGDDFKIKEFDINNPDFNKMIEAIAKEKEAVRKRMTNKKKK